MFVPGMPPAQLTGKPALANTYITSEQDDLVTAVHCLMEVIS
jgi:hypothetical protein